jgi:hypothetical protein
MIACEPRHGSCGRMSGHPGHHHSAEVAHLNFGSPDCELCAGAIKKCGVRSSPWFADLSVPAKAMLLGGVLRDIPLASRRAKAVAVSLECKGLGQIRHNTTGGLCFRAHLRKPPHALT